MKIWQKTISAVATFALLFNSLAAPLSVLAQDEPSPTPVVDQTTPTPTDTPTDTPTPTIEATATPEVTPTVTPVDTVTPTPEVTPEATDLVTPTPTDQPVETPTPTATPTSSSWTFEKVELNKEYVAPQNSGVKLTFTKLPDPSGNIKIEEVTLTPEQVQLTGSLSDKAYDITSDMKDGDFSYNLSLPIPESSKGKTVDVKFAEELSNIGSAAKVENTLTKTDTSVSVTSLDHFTIFVVVTPNPVSANCDGAGVGIAGTDKCFNTIQSAINDPATVTGSIINVYPGKYDQDEANGYNYKTGGVGADNFNIFVNKSITLQGVNASGVPITNYNDVAAFVIPNRNTPSGNLSTIFVQADNVTISGLDVTAFDDPNDNFKTISVIGDNVTIKDSKLHAGDQVSSIYIYDPNYNATNDTSHIQSYRFEGNSLDAGGIYASGIRISSGPGWSGDSTNRIISGNTISNGSYGIEFVGPGGDSWDLYPVGAATITSNNFSDQNKGAISAWGDYKSSVGYGNIDWSNILSHNSFDKAVSVWTSANELRSWETGSFKNIRGIYSAIQKYPINQVAQSGDTINVTAGTYTEVGQIVINKNLSIVGADKATTIIKTNQDTTNSGDSKGWFLVKAGVTFNISNVTLDGAGYKIFQGIRDYGKGTIDNVKFVNIKYNESGGDYAGTAIVAFGGTPSAPMNVDVTNSDFSGIGRVGVLYYGTGITGSTYNKNTYTGKGAGNWLDYAVEVGAGANATISNSTISGNIGVATVDGSTSAGVIATTIYGSGTQATITGNTISNCTDSIGVGYDTNDTSAVVAHNNKLGGNVNGVTSTKPLVDATNNWWGNASGPKDTVSGDNSILNTNPNGIGSAAIGAIKYAPWYTDEGLKTLTSANPITGAATSITSTDATLNGTNGSYDAIGHSFWVSLAPFVTTSPSIPVGVYSTPVLGAISANGNFSASLSSITNTGVPSNLPTVTPNTTYYFAAWSNVGDGWYPGAVLNFTTDPAPDTTTTTTAASNGGSGVSDGLGCANHDCSVHPQVLGISTTVGIWPKLAYAGTSGGTNSGDEVLGASISASPTPESSSTPEVSAQTPANQGFFDWILTHKKIDLGVILIILAVIFGLNGLRRKNK